MGIVHPASPPKRSTLPFLISQLGNYSMGNQSTENNHSEVAPRGDLSSG